MFEFIKISHPDYTVGRAIVTSDERYLRITHVFSDCIYAIWVREPEYARYARRPQRFSYSQIEKLLKETGAAWGKISLPSALLLVPEKGSIEQIAYDSTWAVLKPLISTLEIQRNLDRDRYTYLIQRYAEVTKHKFITLHRLVIRYYYFGCDKRALLHLPPGTRPATDNTSPTIKTANRRGRQPAISKIRGPNKFVITEDDIADIKKAAKRCTRGGPTFISEIHINYLSHEFRKRHPKIYAAYEKEQIPEPITLRQVRYYLKLQVDLEEVELENIPKKRKSSPGYSAAHHALGPGAIYELDASGGRMHIRSSDIEATLLGTAIIYLIIDRWSRFCVSAYISLKPASYEELKYALLIAFTSRVPRFPILGINVDDEIWPRGVLCASIGTDRGSELISQAMMEAVTDSLRIPVMYMPPYNPDAKAIIERFIGAVKNRQASAGVPGSFMDRPLDPKSRQRFEKAKVASVNRLVDAYRELIKIITEHNNAPHRSLRKMATQAGVLPTPQAMYLWGLENVTGLRTCAYSDNDIYKLLLESTTGSIGQGIVRYKEMHYEPFNKVAQRLARKSTHKFRAIKLRIDKTEPSIAYIPQRGSKWAEFSITRGSLDKLRGTTLAEQESLANQSLLLWSIADQDSRLERVRDARIRAEHRTAPPPLPEHSDQDQVKQKRQRDTQGVKAALKGRPTQSGNTTTQPDDDTVPPRNEREDVLIKLIDEQVQQHLEGKK
ncbi:DDE-type integrase/transposase/recombinase [Cupriavidus sp. UYPR2.512]|uniref:DDE-type integrase/transposase/recombinase n=1 Tax=Cupriavidus sp. UYPR2.512 TaxID=1080187 RepID=UPI0012FA749C|nr:DDE-type integrase/transposase/recombinase [Cupriavidus sp. UYPR2.512]UIF90067.1 transposase family protein [Cupriavidus necator]